MTDKPKSTLADKAATAAAIGIGVTAAAAIIPQDELMKRGIPGFWEAIKGFLTERWEDVKIGAKKFRPVAFAWGAKLWSAIKWWTLVSAALIVAGIEVKTRFESDAGHVLVAAGTISFAGLGLLLFVLSDAIATVLFYKIKIAGGVFKKTTGFIGIELPVPTEEEKKERKEKIQKLHDKVRLVLGGTTVLCFSLIFTMLFPAWSTLGWTLLFWAFTAVALCCALYLDLKMGKAITVVFYITVGMLAATFVVFILDRVTGGAIGFAPVREWVKNWNATSVIIGLEAIILATLLVLSAFAKDADGKFSEGRRSALLSGVKYLAIAFVLADAFLLYSGSMSWKDGTGHETPKAVKQLVDTIDNGTVGGSKKAEPELNKQSTDSYQGMKSNGGGTYISPPSGTDPMPHEDPSSVRAPKPRAKKPPLPPLKAQEYTDEAQAYNDIDSI